MQSNWIIKYWPESKIIERWLKKLTNDQKKSVAKEVAVLKKIGNGLKLPHSKALGKRLFELRERTYGYRIYYMFYDNQIIILLAAGDKSTQANDIKTARDRLEMILKKQGFTL